MNWLLIPTKPEHQEMCWATRLHGTNAPNGKALQSGDLYFQYITEEQNVVALCRIVEGPYPPPDGMAKRLWDQDYNLVWRFEVLNSYEPLHISWKGMPGGSPCKYGFTPPSIGPVKLTPQGVAALLEDLG